MIPSYHYKAIQVQPIRLAYMHDPISYKDIFYSVYERKLEENNINRIELYDFNKVIQICNKQMTDDKLQINHSGSKLVKIVTNLIIYDFNKQK